jgi:hypothetical protein
MNTQEAFDAAVEHLRKQGKRSQSKYSTDCLYRGPNGLKCAVGALIPDELYEKSYEGRAIKVLVYTADNMSKLFRNVNIDMLVTLQRVHDCVPAEQWEHNFECIAKRYELTLTPSAG